MASKVTGQSAILHAPTAESGQLGSQPGVVCFDGDFSGIDFAVEESAARALPWVMRQGRIVLNAFVSRCIPQAWALSNRECSEKSNRTRILRRLSKPGGLKFRHKAADPAVAKRRTTIFEIIAPPYAQKRKEGHAKGADDNHSFGSAISCLEGVLTTLPIQKALMEEIGEIPSARYCAQLLREKLGGVDPYSEVKDHLQRTIGFRPLYDGHVLLVDATGIPVKVNNAWGKKAVGEKGNRNGFQKRWAYLSVDVHSANTWIGTSFTDNEGDGWPIFMDWLLFDSLQYAPKHVSCDQASGLFSNLRDIEPGKPIPLHKAIIKWLAAGVKPYVHQPKRPTGGAHAEVAVKGMKSTLNEITVRKALEKEMAGHGLKKARHFESEAEFIQTFDELRAAVNQKHLARAGDIRANLWADPESAAKRNERALVGNARVLSDDIVSRAKVGLLTGNLCVAKVHGERVMAEIDTPLDFKPQESPALVLPCGLRVGDDPERVRILIVEQRAGQPLYHQAEAKVSKKDKRGFDLLQPVFGTGFRAQPDTARDELKRVSTATAKLHKERVAKLRQGTTNDLTDDDCYGD